MTVRGSPRDRFGRSRGPGPAVAGRGGSGRPQRAYSAT